nr:hypothetical protein [uncultured bacterium]
MFTSVDGIAGNLDNVTYRNRSGSGARTERRQPLARPYQPHDLASPDRPTGRCAPLRAFGLPPSAPSW